MHPPRDHPCLQVLSVCTTCPGYGVPSLAYSYDTGTADGVVSAEVAPLPAVPGVCMERVV